MSDSPERLIVVAAYRDYKTAEEVLKAWNEDKDFLIRDVSCKDDGRYVNRLDAENYGLQKTTFYIRYKRKEEIAVIRKVNGEWILLTGDDNYEI